MRQGNPKEWESHEAIPDNLICFSSCAKVSPAQQLGMLQEKAQSCRYRATGLNRRSTFRIPQDLIAWNGLWVRNIKARGVFGVMLELGLDQTGNSFLRFKLYVGSLAFSSHVFASRFVICRIPASANHLSIRLLQTRAAADRFAEHSTK